MRTHNGVSLRLTKQVILPFGTTRVDPEDVTDAQQNKPDTERRALTAVTRVWNLKPSNSRKPESWPEAAGTEAGVALATGAEFQSCETLSPGEVTRSPWLWLAP